jgi:hypothetical protein
MFLAYVMYVPILFLYVPDHWCTPDPILMNSSLTKDQVLHLSVPSVEGKRNQCHMYNVDFSQASRAALIIRT